MISASRTHTTGIISARGFANPAVYLFALLWLALCQALFVANEPSHELEGSHVEGSLGIAKGLVPATNDTLAHARRETWPQDEPPEPHAEPALLDATALPTLTLASSPFLFLRRIAPLPAALRPGSPRAPPIFSRH